MPKVKRKKIKTSKMEIVKTIVETKDRDVLVEGRDNGIGFAFLKKMPNGVFNTVQPLSPCKDYLSEVIITENYNVGTKGCGLNYPQKLNIFDKKVAYMAMQLTKTKSGYYNGSFENDLNLLERNHKNGEFLVNQFEELMDIKIRTLIEKVNDNYYLVTLPIEWCRSTSSISLYTLLLRVAVLYYDGKQDMMTFLKTFKGSDSNLIKQVFEKIQLILKEKQFPPNRYAMSRNQLKSGIRSPHNNGIVSWDSKFEEVDLTD